MPLHIVNYYYFYYYIHNQNIWYEKIYILSFYIHKLLYFYLYLEPYIEYHYLLITAQKEFILIASPDFSPLIVTFEPKEIFHSSLFNSSAINQYEIDIKRVYVLVC